MSPPLLKRDLSEDSETEAGGNPKKLAIEARPAPTTTIASTTIVDSKDSMSSELPPSATPSPARPSWEVNGPTMGSAADAHYIPEGADFAVVISPRREEPRGDRSSTTVAESSVTAGSREVSAGPSKSRFTNEELKQIEDEEPTKFLLFWYRQVIQARRRRVDKEGPAVLDKNDIKVLTSTLDGLAYYPWPPDEAQRKDYMTASGIGKAVRFLLKAAHYGDNISGMATKLQARWQAGDFEPKPVSGDNNLISDESDSEDEARPANLQNTPTYGNGLVKHLMRGVSRYYNAKGTLTSKLDPSFRKQDADVFGHNGLTVGDWWPFQLCCLRDGAHGSRQGGIAGRIASGAFSIVVSGLSEYKDRDTGDELFYSGTTTPSTGPGDTAATQTNATKALAVSSSNGKPVRVLRKGPCNSGHKLYPACGYRYDGLYTVMGGTIIAGGKGERDFWRFRLVRNAGQAPIARDRPTKDEIAAYNSLTS